MGFRKSDKGLEGGKCNKGGCDTGLKADRYNYGSMSWYCANCAHMINNANKNTAEAKHYPNRLLCHARPLPREI